MNSHPPNTQHPTPNTLTNTAIVLFDGECNFCSAAAKFIIARDWARRFRLASLQGETGRELLARHDLTDNGPDSIVLVTPARRGVLERVYTESEAILRIARGLIFPFPLLWAFIALPAPLRDVAYRLFARNRYRMFGRKTAEEACALPPPEVRERFLP